SPLSSPTLIFFHSSFAPSSSLRLKISVFLPQFIAMDSEVTKPKPKPVMIDNFEMPKRGNKIKANVFWGPRKSGNNTTTGENEKRGQKATAKA
ncbi:unnamed protein product, partial [Ilex paraguariensis]